MPRPAHVPPGRWGTQIVFWSPVTKPSGTIRATWKTIQLAHAVRALTEDYGLKLKQVAGRLKRTEVWLSNLLNLVMLPHGQRTSNLL